MKLYNKETPTGIVVEENEKYMRTGRWGEKRPLLSYDYNGQGERREAVGNLVEQGRKWLSELVERGGDELEDNGGEEERTDVSFDF